MEHITSLIANYTIYDFIGNVGVAVLVITFFMLQIGKLSQHGVWYSIWNIIAAILLGISLLHSWNLSSFVIEIFWVIIGFIGIVRYMRRDKDELGQV